MLNVLGYTLVMVVLAFMGHAVHWQGLPVAVAGLFGLWLLATGMALALAALYVFIRDVEHVVSHGLSLLFYLSPVLFSVAMVPAMLAEWMWLNPVTALLEGIRTAWLTGLLTPAIAMWQSIGAGALALVAGWWLFQRLAPHFEEEL